MVQLVHDVRSKYLPTVTYPDIKHMEPQFLVRFLYMKDLNMPCPKGNSEAIAKNLRLAERQEMITAERGVSQNAGFMLTLKKIVGKFKNAADAIYSMTKEITRPGKPVENSLLEMHPTMKAHSHFSDWADYNDSFYKDDNLFKNLLECKHCHAINRMKGKIWDMTPAEFFDYMQWKHCWVCREPLLTEPAEVNLRSLDLTITNDSINPNVGSQLDQLGLMNYLDMFDDTNNVLTEAAVSHDLRVFRAAMSRFNFTHCTIRGSLDKNELKELQSKFHNTSFGYCGGVATSADATMAANKVFELYCNEMIGTNTVNIESAGCIVRGKYMFYPNVSDTYELKNIVAALKESQKDHIFVTVPDINLDFTKQEMPQGRRTWWRKGNQLLSAWADSEVVQQHNLPLLRMLESDVIYGKDEVYLIKTLGRVLGMKLCSISMTKETSDYMETKLKSMDHSTSTKMTLPLINPNSLSGMITGIGFTRKTVTVHHDLLNQLMTKNIKNNLSYQTLVDTARAIAVQRFSIKSKVYALSKLTDEDCMNHAFLAVILSTRHRWQLLPGNAVANPRARAMQVMGTTLFQQLFNASLELMGITTKTGPIGDLLQIIDDSAIVSIHNYLNSSAWDAFSMDNLKLSTVACKETFIDEPLILGDLVGNCEHHNSNCEHEGGSECICCGFATALQPGESCSCCQHAKQKTNKDLQDNNNTTQDPEIYVHDDEMYQSDTEETDTNKIFTELSCRFGPEYALGVKNGFNTLYVNQSIKLNPSEAKWHINIKYSPGCRFKLPNDHVTITATNQNYSEDNDCAIRGLEIIDPDYTFIACSHATGKTEWLGVEDMLKIAESLNKNLLVLSSAGGFATKNDTTTDDFGMIVHDQVTGGNSMHWMPADGYLTRTHMGYHTPNNVIPMYVRKRELKKLIGDYSVDWYESIPWIIVAGLELKLNPTFGYENSVAADTPRFCNRSGRKYISNNELGTHNIRRSLVHVQVPDAVAHIVAELNSTDHPDASILLSGQFNIEELNMHNITNLWEAEIIDTVRSIRLNKHESLGKMHQKTLTWRAWKKASLVRVAPHLYELHSEVRFKSLDLLTIKMSGNIASETVITNNGNPMIRLENTNASRINCSIREPKLSAGSAWRRLFALLMLQPTTWNHQVLSSATVTLGPPGNGKSTDIVGLANSKKALVVTMTSLSKENLRGKITAPSHVTSVEQAAMDGCEGYELLIVDEATMVDPVILACIIRDTQITCHMYGDENQIGVIDTSTQSGIRHRTSAIHHSSNVTRRTKTYRFGETLCEQLRMLRVDVESAKTTDTSVTFHNVSYIDQSVAVELFEQYKPNVVLTFDNKTKARWQTFLNSQVEVETIHRFQGSERSKVMVVQDATDALHNAIVFDRNYVISAASRCTDKLIWLSCGPINKGNDLLSKTIMAGSRPMTGVNISTLTNDIVKNLWSALKGAGQTAQLINEKLNEVNEWVRANGYTDNTSGSKRVATSQDDNQPTRSYESSESEDEFFDAKDHEPEIDQTEPYIPIEVKLDQNTQTIHYSRPITKTMLEHSIPKNLPMGTRYVLTENNLTISTFGMKALEFVLSDDKLSVKYNGMASKMVTEENVRVNVMAFNDAMREIHAVQLRSQRAQREPIHSPAADNQVTKSTHTLWYEVKPASRHENRQSVNVTNSDGDFDTEALRSAATAHAPVNAETCLNENRIEIHMMDEIMVTLAVEGNTLKVTNHKPASPFATVKEIESMLHTYKDIKSKGFKLVKADDKPGSTCCYNKDANGKTDRLRSRCQCNLKQVTIPRDWNIKQIEHYTCQLPDARAIATLAHLAMMIQSTGQTMSLPINGSLYQVIGRNGCALCSSLKFTTGSKPVLNITEWYTDVPFRQVQVAHDSNQDHVNNVLSLLQLDRLQTCTTPIPIKNENLINLISDTRFFLGMLIDRLYATSLTIKNLLLSNFTLPEGSKCAHYDQDNRQHLERKRQMAKSLGYDEAQTHDEHYAGLNMEKHPFMVSRLTTGSLLTHDGQASMALSTLSNGKPEIGKMNLLEFLNKIKEDEATRFPWRFIKFLSGQFQQGNDAGANFKSVGPVEGLIMSLETHEAKRTQLFNWLQNKLVGVKMERLKQSPEIIYVTTSQKELYREAVATALPNHPVNETTAIIPREGYDTISDMLLSVYFKELGKPVDLICMHPWVSVQSNSWNVRAVPPMVANGRREYHLGLLAANAMADRSLSNFTNAAEKNPTITQQDKKNLIESHTDSTTGTLFVKTIDNDIVYRDTIVFATIVPTSDQILYHLGKQREVYVTFPIIDGYQMHNYAGIETKHNNMVVRYHNGHAQVLDKNQMEMVKTGKINDDYRILTVAVIAGIKLCKVTTNDIKWYSPILGMAREGYVKLQVPIIITDPVKNLKGEFVEIKQCIAKQKDYDALCKRATVEGTKLEDLYMSARVMLSTQYYNDNKSWAKLDTSVNQVQLMCCAAYAKVHNMQKQFKQLLRLIRFYTGDRPRVSNLRGRVTEGMLSLYGEIIKFLGINNSMQDIVSNLAESLDDDAWQKPLLKALSSTELKEIKIGRYLVDLDKSAPNDLKQLKNPTSREPEMNERFKPIPYNLSKNLPKGEIKVLCYGFGTRGDIAALQPYTKIITDMGHKVSVITTSDTEYMFKHCHAVYTHNTDQDKISEMMQHCDSFNPKDLLISRENFIDESLRLFNFASKLERHDLIVSNPFTTGTDALCEAWNATLLLITSQPWGINLSKFRTMFGALSNDYLLNRMTWSTIELASQGTNKVINEWRVSRGLEPADTNNRLALSVRKLAGFDGSVFKWSAPNVKEVGWQHSFEYENANEECVRFAKENQPTVVTMGSMKGPKVNRYLTSINEQLMRYPVIFVKGASDYTWKSGKSHICVDKINLNQLLHHCPTMIHHAGAGTTHTAINTKTYSICLPIMGDQVIWTKAVTDLGVGCEGILCRLREQIESCKTPMIEVAMRNAKLNLRNHKEVNTAIETELEIIGLSRIKDQSDAGGDVTTAPDLIEIGEPVKDYRPPLGEKHTSKPKPRESVTIANLSEKVPVLPANIIVSQVERPAAEPSAITKDEKLTKILSTFNLNMLLKLPSSEFKASGTATGRTEARISKTEITFNPDVENTCVYRSICYNLTNQDMREILGVVLKSANQMMYTHKDYIAPLAQLCAINVATAENLTLVTNKSKLYCGESTVVLARQHGRMHCLAGVVQQQLSSTQNVNVLYRPELEPVPLIINFKGYDIHISTKLSGLIDMALGQTPISNINVTANTDNMQARLTGSSAWILLEQQDQGVSVHELRDIGWAMEVLTNTTLLKQTELVWWYSGESYDFGVTIEFEDRWVIICQKKIKFSSVAIGHARCLCFDTTLPKQQKLISKESDIMEKMVYLNQATAQSARAFGLQAAMPDKYRDGDKLIVINTDGRRHHNWDDNTLLQKVHKDDWILLDDSLIDTTYSHLTDISSSVFHGLKEGACTMYVHTKEPVNESFKILLNKTQRTITNNSWEILNKDIIQYLKKVDGLSCVWDEDHHLEWNGSTIEFELSARQAGVKYNIVSDIIDYFSKEGKLNIRTRYIHETDDLDYSHLLSHGTCVCKTGLAIADGLKIVIDATEVKKKKRNRHKKRAESDEDMKYLESVSQSYQTKSEEERKQENQRYTDNAGNKHTSPEHITWDVRQESDNLALPAIDFWWTEYDGKVTNIDFQQTNTNQEKITNFWSQFEDTEQFLKEHNHKHSGDEHKMLVYNIYNPGQVGSVDNMLLKSIKWENIINIGGNWSEIMYDALSAEYMTRGRIALHHGKIINAWRGRKPLPTNLLKCLPGENLLVQTNYTLLCNNTAFEKLKLLADPKILEEDLYEQVNDQSPVKIMSILMRQGVDKQVARSWAASNKGPTGKVSISYSKENQISQINLEELIEHKYLVVDEGILLLEGLQLVQCVLVGGALSQQSWKINWDDEFNNTTDDKWRHSKGDDVNSPKERYAVIMPSGSGKTTLKDSNPYKYLDIDDVLTWSDWQTNEDIKHKVDSPIDWQRINNTFKQRLIDLDDDRIVLCHSKDQLPKGYKTFFIFPHIYHNKEWTAANIKSIEKESSNIIRLEKGDDVDKVIDQLVTTGTYKNIPQGLYDSMFLNHFSHKTLAETNKSETTRRESKFIPFLEVDGGLFMLGDRSIEVQDPDIMTMNMFENLDLTNWVHITYPTTPGVNIAVVHKAGKIVKQCKTLLARYPIYARPVLNKQAYALVNSITTRILSQVVVRKYNLDTANEVKDFVDTYFVNGSKSNLKSFQSNLITFNPEDIKQWLSERPDELKVEQELIEILQDGFTNTRLNHIKVHMKVESLLKDVPINKMADTQVRLIAWQSKGICAMYSSAFKLAKDRLKLLLNHNYVYADGLTPGQVAARARATQDANFFFENDLSKQDRQIDNQMLDCEFGIYEILGVDPHLLKSWRSVHQHWRYKGLGVRGVMDGMRLTGQATTALGNVIVNLLVHKHLVKLNKREIKLMLVLGDDNLIISKNKIDTSGLRQHIADFWNMQSKPATYDNHGTFCSLIAYRGVQGNAGMAPDWVRLSRRYEVPNGVHEVTTDLLKMRGQSYLQMIGATKETLQIIQDQKLNTELHQWYNWEEAVGAMCDKYKLGMEEVENYYKHLLDMIRNPKLITLEWTLTGEYKQ
nr:TPA_asm: hypothetical protein [Pemphredonvirus endornavi]